MNFLAIVATNPLISAVLHTPSNQLFTRSVAVKWRHSGTENEYRRCSCIHPIKMHHYNNISLTDG